AFEPLQGVERRAIEDAQGVEHRRHRLRLVADGEAAEPCPAAARVGEEERRAVGGRGRRGGAHGSSRALMNAFTMPSAFLWRSSGTTAVRCGAAHTGPGKWRSSSKRGITCQCTR